MLRMRHIFLSNYEIFFRDETRRDETLIEATLLNVCRLGFEFRWKEQYLIIALLKLAAY